MKACCETCDCCESNVAGDLICVNIESDNVGDYVSKNDFCYEWEKKDDQCVNFKAYDRSTQCINDYLFSNNDICKRNG